jgi:SulP family sulfate permease
MLAKITKQNIFSNIKLNWKAGLTVALVSIPMSVSISVASGASPVPGIITAIWAGLLAAIFGGSNYNIVGPAGALTGILASFAFTNGASLLPSLAVVSGILILLAFLLRFDKLLVLIPSSVVHGFTLGVAAILALPQLNFAFGLQNVPKHKEFIQNVFESFAHLGNLDIATSIVFVVFLFALFALIRFTPKIPGAIILTPIGILLGYLSFKGLISFDLLTLGERFPDFQQSFGQFTSPVFNGVVIKTAFTVALVAILETMLCGKVADTMTGTRFNKKKELRALGIANIGAGLLGGLPATAVLARTSLNVKSGATNRFSQGINAICIALISLLLITSFRYLPLAVVAAILVFTAIRMVEIREFKMFWKYERISFGISMAAAFFTIYIDPVIGILAGTCIALLVYVGKISRGTFDIQVNDANGMILEQVGRTNMPKLPEHTKIIVYSIKGALNYVTGEAHLNRLFSIKNKYETIIIRLRETSQLDVDGVHMLNEMIEHLQNEGKRVYITGIGQHSEEIISLSKEYIALKVKNQVYRKLSEALAQVRK